MIKIILNGCSGRMGRVITRLAEDDIDCEVVAGLDICEYDEPGYPVYTDFSQCTQEADVIIDFSHPTAVSGLLEFAKKRKIPVIEATTGLSDEQKENLLDASKQIPIFFSANMSLGINLLTELAKKAAIILQNSFDIEIIEKHHNRKLDAPSGTALAIADEISEVLDNKPEYVYDRHNVRRKRSHKEIGIHSVRGGTIVGEHEVVFAGNDEIIEISHRAASREIFAVGALTAAKFMKEKQAGMYSMSDMIGEIV